VNQIIRNWYVQECFSAAWGRCSGKKPVCCARQLRRSPVLALFAKLPPTKVGLEACGRSALLGP